MGVRKYRSVDDMPGPERLRPLDPQNLRIVCELSELTYGLRPWSFEPGVRKYRSIEEASRARDKWERSQMRKPRR